MIITIDGPSATGKSTVAKELAKAIHFIYFDTGAMYRCLTWAVIQKKINIQNNIEIEKLLNTFEFQIVPDGDTRRYLLNGVDVSEEIRDQEVTAMVSEVSAISRVREGLVAIQQSMAKGLNAVFEGRDLGTVVFPDAEIKFFLDADPKIRAKRRYDETLSKFSNPEKQLTLEETLKDLKRRDDYDRNREHSPLKQADDAILIDTSSLNAADVVKKMLELIKQHPLKNQILLKR